MSDTPKPKGGKSGQHPAVQAYRDKLDSIQDTQVQDLEALDRMLDEYISSTPPPPPPPPSSEDELTPTKPDRPAPPPPRLPRVPRPDKKKP